MLHEQRVQRDPVLAGDDLRERDLGLLGRPGADDAETVRDPVHVRVDRDRRDPVAEDQHAVRRLRPDGGQAHQFVVRSGHRAREPIEQFPGAGAYGPGLDAIETGRPDETLDVGGPGGGERSGIRETGEQEGGGPVGVRVLRPLREDRSDQDLEGVHGVVAEVRGTPVARPVEGGEPVEHDLPVDRGRRSGAHAVSLARAGAGAVPGSERSGSSAPSPAARLSSPTR